MLTYKTVFMVGWSFSLAKLRNKTLYQIFHVLNSYRIQVLFLNYFCLANSRTTYRPVVELMGPNRKTFTSSFQLLLELFNHLLIIIWRWHKRVTQNNSFQSVGESLWETAQVVCEEETSIAKTTEFEVILVQVNNIELIFFCWKSENKFVENLAKRSNSCMNVLLVVDCMRLARIIEENNSFIFDLILF